MDARNFRTDALQPLARGLAAAVALSATSCVGTPLVAQLSGSLLGTVTDATTGIALEGATVFVLGTQIDLATDSDGRFWLPDRAVGQLTLRVSSPGYASVTEAIDVFPAEAVFLQVQLARIHTTLDELLATAQPERPGTGGAVAEVLSDPDLRGSALDLLIEQVPGVTIRRDEGLGGGARVRIRGSSSLLNNDPVVYVDGVLVSDRSGDSQIHFLQLIPAEQVRRIRVLKGPAAAAAYGESANGVILIETVLRGGPSGRSDREPRQDPSPG